MNICFICNEYPPGPHGGIGSFTQTMARALAQQGHQVRVVGMYPVNYAAADYEEDCGVQVWRLRRPSLRLGWLRARYRLFRTVAHWSKNCRIDMIEVPDWQGWSAGWPRLSVPVITRLHGTASYFAAEQNKPINRRAFRWERTSLNRADFWCSVSRHTADKTQRLYKLRSNCSAILYNPVERPADASGDTRSSNRVIFTGTLTPKKGIFSLINAWPAVLDEYKDAELHIYGKEGASSNGQSMRAQLRRKLNGKAGNSVHFHGHVSRERIFAELRAARAAVFPSYAEAFAIAPLEAMAQGCPTIYSRRCSGPELIEDSESGLLIDPDQPHEIATAIVRLLKDDRLAERLGETARERVQTRFSIETMLSQNEEFYRTCVHSFRTHSPRNRLFDRAL